MRSIRPCTLLILSLLICTGSGIAQEHPPAPASQSSEQGLATVYVYRLDEGIVVLGFLIKTRPVYFSERAHAGSKRKNRKIAGLKNKHYFMLRLPPGKYIFDTRLMWDHLELEVAAGGTYYLRLDKGDDCPSEDPGIIGPPPCVSRSASIERVLPERWGKDMSVLKPIESKDVKERRLVIIPPGPPADNDLHPTADTTAFKFQ